MSESQTKGYEWLIYGFHEAIVAKVPLVTVSYEHAVYRGIFRNGLFAICIIDLLNISVTKDRGKGDSDRPGCEPHSKNIPNLPRYEVGIEGHLVVPLVVR